LVEVNRGRVAIQRGSIVYCFEAVDNDGRVRNIQLDRDPQLQTQWKPDLLSGVVMISAKTSQGRAGCVVACKPLLLALHPCRHSTYCGPDIATQPARQGRTVGAIPYYAWDTGNRAR